jgi:glutamate formiminotransferase / 5-formyltetrahydrofolate cyclo-ligase
VGELDLRDHAGVHPRLGVLDVVPFVPLDGSTDADALAARDHFAAWLADAHGVPCFLYGPERSLPDIRRTAFTSLAPDLGPAEPHPSAGATAVGQRGALVAYNVWLRGTTLAGARRVAAAVRGPGVRALGLQVDARLQVSMNLVDPTTVGPADAYDRVTVAGHELGATVDGAELVGLLPLAVLDAVPRRRWVELGLEAGRTIEARVDAAERRRG